MSQQKSMIRDAYVSIEIADQAVSRLREGLRSVFDVSGITCEPASSVSHVSIAYGEGDADVELLEQAAAAIAALPFSVRVVGFEILEGGATPFDYLVALVEGECFSDAVSAVSDCMKTRSFHGGLRSHLSLLRFPKGHLAQKRVARMINEMNICQEAAAALGRQVALCGSKVSIYSCDRECRLSKQINAVAA